MDRAIVEAQLRQIVASAEATKAAAEALLRELARQEVDPGPVVVPEPTPPRIPEPQPPTPGRDDAAERLVAMKMALDGASLTEINQKLDERFGPALRSKLIYDVFERAGR